MSMEPITGEQMLNAIDAMRRSLETQEQFDPDRDLVIAAKFNARRKEKMIVAMREYYACQHGQGPRPDTLPSKAFNPNEGRERTNIYYIFKELKKRLPWELNHNILIEPIAYTLVMLDVANKLYPCPILTRGMITFQGLVNLLTISEFNPEPSPEANQRKRDDYFRKIDKAESDMTQFYADMATYFAEIECPDKNPVAKEIHETYATTKRVAHRLKVDAAEKRPSAVAQEKALKLWEAYRRDPSACVKGRKATHSSVFTLCKRDLAHVGITNVEAFKKAIDLAQKRKRAVQN